MPSRGAGSTIGTSKNVSPPMGDKSRHMRNATMATINIAADIDGNNERIRQRSRTPGVDRPMTGQVKRERNNLF